MTSRDIFTWKTYFYRGLLPALRGLGASRADAAVGGLGRLGSAFNPRLRRTLTEAAGRARDAARGRPGGWRQPTPADLAAGLLRFHARDYLLDTPDDDKALGRFDVSGWASVRDAIDAGRGLVLVGAHLGGHLAALHWLYRNRIPLRLMVQRPRHVSKALDAFFDRDEPDPQSAYFLRRGLGPTDCVERLLRVRGAVRSGRAVYFAGDVPWQGPNTREGRLLGRNFPFLAVWADLAALTGAPVVFTFCGHRPGGRFDLTFEPIGAIRPGEEGRAVACYLDRLEARIAADPADAPAHLLWPCYGPTPEGPAAAGVTPRPGRRTAVVPL